MYKSLKINTNHKYHKFSPDVNKPKATSIKVDLQDSNVFVKVSIKAALQIFHLSEKNHKLCFEKMLNFKISSDYLVSFVTEYSPKLDIDSDFSFFSPFHF